MWRRPSPGARSFKAALLRPAEPSPPPSCSPELAEAYHNTSSCTRYRVHEDVLGYASASSDEQDGGDDGSAGRSKAAVKLRAPGDGLCHTSQVHETTPATMHLHRETGNSALTTPGGGSRRCCWARRAQRRSTGGRTDTTGSGSCSAALGPRRRHGASSRRSTGGGFALPACLA